MSNLPLLAVAGPTGAGKSPLALVLAERFDGEIVNFDSVQVYAGFNVGSAKLPGSGRRGIPHHLIDLCAPGDPFTAGDFVAEVRALLPGIAARGRLPILCGGTGFYLRALLQGLTPGLERDDALRARLRAREARRPGAIRRLLTRLDPAAADRIHVNDANKTLRALELRVLAGRPAGDHFFSGGLAPLAGYNSLVLALDPPREALYTQLNRRCEEIWQGGLLDEVRGLLDSGVSPGVKPFESLGYRQALRYLGSVRKQPLQSLPDGPGSEADTEPRASASGRRTMARSFENASFVEEGFGEAEALEEMRVRTRQYAKRQWTWFRAEKGIEWISGFGSEEAAQQAAVEKVTAFLKKTSVCAEHFPGSFV